MDGEGYAGKKGARELDDGKARMQRVRTVGECAERKAKASRWKASEWKMMRCVHVWR